MKTELAEEFAKLAPWVFQFRIGERDYGGGISAVGDARIDQFFRFAPNARTILELGSLEGAHTFILSQREGVERVVAIEGREANLRKARFVQKLLGIQNIEFVEANLENAALTSFGKFDAVFCSGLLYHLPEPWKLVEQLPKAAPLLFVWTQYAAEHEAKDLGNGLCGKIYIEGGPDEPLSGMSRSATWLTLPSLRTVLARAGYRRIEIIHDDVSHQNGPAVTFGAAEL
ncbi:MAG: class I SAM-dependent methyltransferase [Chthoniobacterales bacterium]